jgi:DNA-binding GntR family transcriptional regulator
VSRTPVRQALFRLQQEGYVEVLFQKRLARAAV